jgi:hypothetical protein
MQAVERPGARCPEPDCGGRVLVLLDYDGYDVVRYPACSLCGRQPRGRPAVGRRPPASEDAGRRGR